MVLLPLLLLLGGTEEGIVGGNPFFTNGEVGLAGESSTGGVLLFEQEQIPIKIINKQTIYCIHM